ncbi:MAG: rubredoxin [bacterium]
MNRYLCGVCGFIYDPEVGDSGAGVPSGTNFEELPDDWECPVCGVNKSQFKKVGLITRQ